MDIFEWIFKKRPKEKYIQGVRSLKRPIKSEIRLFDNLWQLHKEKRTILRQNTIRRHFKLKVIIRLNNESIEIINRILGRDDLIEVLIRKILFESTERLHEAEGWVKRYGDEKPPTWEQEYGNVVTPKGIGVRRPYFVEQAKRTILERVKDEEGLERFIMELSREIDGEFKALKGLFDDLKSILDGQARKAEYENINFKEFSKEEDVILLKIRHVLMDIVNKIILFSRKTTSIEFDEQKIVDTVEHTNEQESVEIPKRVGVMLIHGVLSTPKDYDELQTIFQRQGFITYNVRFSGHGHTIDDFLTTPLGQMQSSLISAFKYFYQYMAAINDGDGRFYVVGNSLGAMLPLHIMAISWGKKYPYQAMIKGIISMGALIIPMDVKKLTKLHSRLLMSLIIGKLGVEKYNKQSLDSEISSESVEEINIKIKKLRDAVGKGQINPNKFEGIVRAEIRPMLRSKLERTKRLLAPSDFMVYFGDDEEQVIDEMVEAVWQNINRGKRPMDQGNILDIRVLVNREKLGIDLPAKRTASSLRLMSDLYNDLRKIRIPILVVHGQHDTLAHPKSGKLIYNRVKTKRKFKSILELKNSGHMPMMDLEKEEVFKESVKFIKESEEGWIGADNKRQKRKKK
jgi:esterase/lipase